MDIGFSEEQELLAETVRSLTIRSGPRSAQELDSADADALWDTLCGLGLPGLRVPPSAGGSGATVTDAMVVVEELARGMVPVPFLGRVLGAELLTRAGAPVEILSEVASGDRKYTVALDSSLRGLARAGDPAALAWDAEGATGAVALDAGGAVCIVGVDPAPLPCADLARTVRRTRSEVLITADEIGAPLTHSAVAGWTATALSLLAADLLGAMEAALAAAVDYSKERIQFGQPIGSFQAVQHICADAHVATEATRSGVWYATWAVDGLAVEESLRAAQIAKAFAAEAGVAVSEAAIQVHGGIAFTWDTLPHLYLRRCLVTRQVLGDEDDLYRELAIAGHGTAA